MQGSNIDYAMTCQKLGGSRSRRHEDWKDALSRVTACAGCSNRAKPGYNEVGMAAPGRAGSRAEIEARLPREAPSPLSEHAKRGGCRPRARSD